MKNEIIIRNAEKADVRQIAEILVEDWQKAYRGIIDDAFLDSMNAVQRYDIEVKRYKKYLMAMRFWDMHGWRQQKKNRRIVKSLRSMSDIQKGITV